MLTALRRWLRFSRHIHIRQGEVVSFAEVVGLIDRFMDYKLHYPLEWDDFISWKHTNGEIEEVRLRLAQTEPLFCSKREEDRQQGTAIMLRERNQLATSVGLPIRQSGFSDRHWELQP
jgi:hypothetical protein